MTLRKIKLVETSRPFEYLSLFPDEEHTLLVCAVDNSVSASERAKLSTEIVAAKCRYAVCWSHQCSDWDTAIDLAYIDMIGTDKAMNLPDDTFVMTTWHDDETIEETIEFWWMNTSFENYQSSNLGILIVGEDSALISKIRHIVSDLECRWHRPRPESEP